ncbi:hypothetical protein TIFTF001_022010 [Ficus carica]|uniref:Uncharacterized protein n=1 Tax=Ficus carica TaxID=3494 RepID=A0AA88ALD9_FICCA|nr:hypothetical protein TIFTF001_022010 [Ficus carica]
MAEMMALMLAEAVVSQVVQRITDLLIQEAASLSSVRNDVQILRTELTRIKCFLEDVDHKQEQGKRMQNWVAEVRDVACEIEDTIETYIYKLNYSSCITASYHRRKLRAEIGSIKDKLNSIRKSTQTYQISFSSGGGSSGSLRHLRRSSPKDHDEEDDIISLKAVTTLKNRLILEENDQHRIISVVGMGGLGKTTLAKKVYNDRDVKQHFDCAAWVPISQQCQLRYVLSEILIHVGFVISDELTSNTSERRRKEGLWEERAKERAILDALKEDDLEYLIENELGEKRYLVVLDDIWRNEDWDSIDHVLPKGTSGSKVVFTTRNRELALNADPYSLPIEPPLLTPEESWELLRHKAFPKDATGQWACTPEDRIVGKEMVKRCEGLPGAIVVLGGLLRTKTYDEWLKVQNDVNLYLNKHRFGSQHGVEEMLALSYHDLPYYLKPCFLYLCCFPKDHLGISRRKLLRLWIAEGFITVPIRSCQTPKEIAEGYFRELIDRCMIQVSKRDFSELSIKTCHMHDLMLDFCMAKARKENFSQIIQQQEQDKQTMTTSSFLMDHHFFTTHTRRIALHSGCNLGTDQMHPHLRSLLCFDVSSTSLVEYLRSMNLRLLRVLEVWFIKGNERTEVCKVPAEIGDFIHLRYLGMRDAKRIKMPRSIGSLRSLDTINLRDNDEVVLPREILRLTRLRHLLLPFDTRIPYGISWKSCGIHSYPTHIETLRYVKFGPLLLRKKTTNQVTLKYLQNLGIQFNSSVEVKHVLKTPNFELRKLQSLFMSLNSSDPFPCLQSLSECSVLISLTLDGKISDSLDFLPESLTKLVLKNSMSEKEPMENLEKLPKLKFLRLDNAYSGSTLVCNKEGFPRMETLQLFSLEDVEDWEVHENAMPNLKSLHIERMPKLQMIPEGLKDIASIKELKISEMERSFADRLSAKDGIEGPDFYKVSRVRSLSFSWMLPSN